MSTAATIALDTAALLPETFLSLTGSDPKFTEIHVLADPRLHKAAVVFAKHYAGTFPYMLEMQSKASLNPRQCAGILNCLRADVRRQVAEREAAGVAPETFPILPPFGYYTLVGTDGGHVTLRFSQKLGRPGIAGVISYLTGPDNTTNYQGFGYIRDNGAVQLFWTFQTGYDRQVNAVKALLASDDAALAALGFAYAMTSGRCYCCGRLLTNPESIESGIGPECAKKVGQ